MPELSKASKIIEHELFIKTLSIIEEQEKDRIYCRHDMAHFLDVARAGMIFILERDYDIPADVMYGAALTHDLGRAREYTDGTPHDQAGVEIAQRILPDCGYKDAEVAEIIMAIAAHRIKDSGMKLAEVLYEADKRTRPCFACPAADTCNWPEEKKNLKLTV